MALGADGTVCTDELVAAMRSRLDMLDPPAGQNVDQAEVRANFAALGAGVHAILTGAGRAQTRSSAAQDSVFWDWIAAMSAFADGLAAWRTGLREAVSGWTPADAAGQAFRAAVLAIPDPPDPPESAPAALVGVIR